VDALAYYLPFHFYRDGVWGIYIRAKGAAAFAAVIKAAPLTTSDSPLLTTTIQVLIDHEYFHCVVEGASTCVEIVNRIPNYHRYFHNAAAAEHEEAMANAHAFRNVRRKNKAIVPSVDAWMRKQGRGYNRFDDFVKNSDFQFGKVLCGTILVSLSPDSSPPAYFRLLVFFFKKSTRMKFHCSLSWREEPTLFA